MQYYDKFMFLNHIGFKSYCTRVTGIIRTYTIVAPPGANFWRYAYEN